MGARVHACCVCMSVVCVSVLACVCVCVCVCAYVFVVEYLICWLCIECFLNGS